MIDLTPFIDLLGDAGAAAATGATAGLAFGVLAQRSKFCMRSAAIELSRARAGAASAVWLAAFGAAILAVQFLTSNGSLATESVRQLTEPTSISGAIAGGLLFGVGMVLARGCASRHLVLAGSGNLRAWVVFALFGLTALATISGPLKPAAQSLASLWTLHPDHANVLANLGAGAETGMLTGALILAASVALAVASRVSALLVAGGTAIGLLAALGFGLTSALSAQTFEPTQVESLSFTGPAANVATYLWGLGGHALSFDTGFIPAVLAGALIAAAASGEFRVQWFESLASANRYAAGAVLMGFGGVIAVGCSVGNLTSASLMITTAWAALASILLGGMATNALLSKNWARADQSDDLPSEAAMAVWVQ